MSRLLTEFLGTWIHNPPKENIDIQTRKGILALNDLRLREDAVDGLLFLLGFPWASPLRVLHGTVASVVLDLPLTSMKSKPTNVTVEGVDIVLGMRPTAVCLCESVLHACVSHLPHSLPARTRYTSLLCVFIHQIIWLRVHDLISSRRFARA